MPSRPHGGISKWDDGRATLIYGLLKRGNTRTVAGRLAGISHDTFARWYQARADFRDGVDAAEAEAQVLLLDTVRAAATKPGSNSWIAAAWILERRWPETFGRKERLDIAIDVRKEAEKIADELGISVEQVLAEADAILKGNG